MMFEMVISSLSLFKLDAIPTIDLSDLVTGQNPGNLCQCDEQNDLGFP